MRSLLAPLVLAIVVVFGTGCGPQAKKDRALKQADAYFAAGEFDKAEIEYRNAQRIEPLNAHAIGRLGLIYFEQGRQLRAFSFLTKAVELQPNDLDLKVKFAALQISVRKLNEARDAAWAVLAKRPLDPEAPILVVESCAQPKEMAEARERLLALPAPAAEGAPVLVALGLLEFRQRKVDEAEVFFQRALKRDPKSADAQAGLGIVALSRKDAAKAEVAFKAASAAAPLRSPKRLQYAQLKLQSGDAAAGRQLLEEVAKATPDYLPAWLALAQLSATEKKPEEALGYLAKILARESAHPEALLLSGRMRLAKGETDKAIAEMERTALTFAQLPQAHFELAQAYLAKGDVGKATASINQAVNLAPRYTEAVVAQAGINIRKGDLAPAVASLQKVVQQRPDILEARSLLADALRQQGKLDDALAVYADAEKVFPRLPTVPFFRGLILAQQKKFPEARQAFARAVELAPSYTAAVEQLVQLDLRDKKADEARSRVEALITKTPKSAEGYVLLARVMMAQKDTKMVEMALQKAISVQPEAPAAYFLLARMQNDNKEADKALANLKAVVAQNPKNAEALRMMSAIYQEQSNHKAALDTYEKFLAASPDYGKETTKVVGSIYNNLAYLYAEQFNQIDKGFEMAQKARELLPLDPNVADTLGWVLYKKGQYGPALAMLQESAEKLGTAAEVQYHLGMAHYMQGEEGAARAALKRALELDGNFPGNKEARTRLVVLGDDAAALGVDAKTALEKTVAERKDDPVALARLAGLYERDGALDKAAATYEAALAASPKNVNAMLGLARVLSARKDDVKALEMAKAARKIAPEDADVAHLLGRLASQSGQHSWGYSLLQEAVRKKEDSPEILVDTAEAAFRLGKVAESEAAMKRALEINPGFPRAGAARRFLEMLAIAAAPSDPAAMGKVDAVLKSSPNDAPALMAAGAVQELKRDAASARKSYEKVLSLYPEHIVAKKRFAILAATAKDADMKKALEYATKARETYPDDADVAKALGIIMYRQGTLPRAATLLQESSRKRENDAEVFFYLGMTKQKQQSKADAKAALQRALELKLGGEDAAEARKVLAELK